MGLWLSGDVSHDIDPRLAVEQGDKSFLAKQYDQALHFYQLAYEAEPSAKHSKRKVMALLALGDADNLMKALRQYQKDGATAEDLEFIEQYWQAFKKDPKAKSAP